MPWTLSGGTVVVRGRAGCSELRDQGKVDNLRAQRGVWIEETAQVMAGLRVGAGVGEQTSGGWGAFWVRSIPGDGGTESRERRQGHRAQRSQVRGLSVSFVLTQWERLEGPRQALGILGGQWAGGGEAGGHWEGPGQSGSRCGSWG